MAEYELVGHEIDTPLLNAAGAINGTGTERILEEVGLLARTAIGAITVGSFTVPEQAGNEVRPGESLYRYDTETHTTYNLMGLPNIGLEAAVKRMPEMAAIAHDRGKLLIASVSPTQNRADIGDTFEQSARLIDEIQATSADLIELNASCPNIVTDTGERKPILGYDLEGMQHLIERLTTIAGRDNRRLGVKLPPYLHESNGQLITDLADLFNRSRVFAFLVTANTVPSDEGGMSGPAMSSIGQAQLQLWRSHIDTGIDIISTLGVANGKEIAARRNLGAAAVGGVTFLWESSDWGKAVTDILTEWIEAEELYEYS